MRDAPKTEITISYLNNYLDPIKYISSSGH